MCTLNHYVVAELARDPEKTAEQVTRTFLESAFGAGVLDEAMQCVEEYEELWTRMISRSQREAGFNWPWHTVFTAGMFPARLMNEPAPRELVDDIEAAIEAAERAVNSAEEMGRKGAWRYHALDTNILVVSAKLILQRMRFRLAKLPVLDAIRTGDLKAAISGFRDLTMLAREMVETASSAPNTAVLNTHWTKLALLPERLEAMKLHLPEIVERKKFRDIFTVGPKNF